MNVMKKRFLLFYTIFSFFVLIVSAQEISDSNNTEIEEFRTEQKAKYWDNWFVSVGTGVNLLWGEQDQEIAGITDRLKFGGGNLSLGKWFNPAFGIRLQAIYAPLKGYNYIQPRGGYYEHPGAPDQKSIVPVGFIVPDDAPYGGNYIDISLGSDPRYQNIIYSGENALNNWRNFEIAKNGRVFVQSFNYWSATFDLMANLVPLFRGYNKDGSLLDIIPFAGVGLIHAQPSNSTTNYTYGVLKFGARINFNINSNLAVFAEAQGNITARDFDSYIGDELFDAIFHAQAGVQYTINKRFETPSGGGTAFLSPEEIDYLNDKINKNRERLDKHEAILNRQQDLLDRLNQGYEDRPTTKVEREVITQTEVVSTKYLPEYIRFTLNSTQIQFSEERKFKEAAEFLNANPSSKLLLVGYADKKTGTSTYNYDLSRRRVEAVSEELIRRGVNPNRLILEWRGDQEQPYAPNDWNRVVIMVER
jgi:outer membrane protein OmpA-like peptidoglycan-associated protein